MERGEPISVDVASSSTTTHVAAEDMPELRPGFDCLSPPHKTSPLGSRCYASEEENVVLNTSSKAPLQHLGRSSSGVEVDEAQRQREAADSTTGASLEGERYCAMMEGPRASPPFASPLHEHAKVKPVRSRAAPPVLSVARRTGERGIAPPQHAALLRAPTAVPVGADGDARSVVVVSGGNAPSSECTDPLAGTAKRHLCCSSAPPNGCSDFPAPRFAGESDCSVTMYSAVASAPNSGSRGVNQGSRGRASPHALSSPPSSLVQQSANPEQAQTSPIAEVSGDAEENCSSHTLQLRCSDTVPDALDHVHISSLHEGAAMRSAGGRAMPPQTSASLSLGSALPSPLADDGGAVSPQRESSENTDAPAAAALDATPSGTTAAVVPRNKKKKAKKKKITALVEAATATIGGDVDIEGVSKNAAGMNALPAARPSHRIASPTPSLDDCAGGAATPAIDDPYEMVAPGGWRGSQPLLQQQHPASAGGLASKSTQHHETDGAYRMAQELPPPEGSFDPVRSGVPLRGGRVGQGGAMDYGASVGAAAAGVGGQAVPASYAPAIHSTKTMGPVSGAPYYSDRRVGPGPTGYGCHLGDASVEYRVGAVGSYTPPSHTAPHRYRGGVYTQQQQHAPFPLQPHPGMMAINSFNGYGSAYTRGGGPPSPQGPHGSFVPQSYSYPQPRPTSQPSSGPALYRKGGEAGKTRIQEGFTMPPLQGGGTWPTEYANYSSVPDGLDELGCVTLSRQPSLSQRNAIFRCPVSSSDVSGIEGDPSVTATDFSRSTPYPCGGRQPNPHRSNHSNNLGESGGARGRNGMLRAHATAAAPPATVASVDGGGGPPSEETLSIQDNLSATEGAVDATTSSVLSFTPEVSPRLCRLVEREVLGYLVPSLENLRRRRTQLHTLATYITAALRYAERQTGHHYGDISFYIFGSVNMRTVLPDGDNDVTIEVNGLVPPASSQTPPPSPAPPLESLPEKGNRTANPALKTGSLPFTTDSNAGNMEGTLQLATTADGSPRLAAPAVLSIASGEVLGHVRDYLRNAQTPIFVDSLVMAEVRVLKLAMEGCNYDITIGQFGGVNCVRFLHEIDAVIGGQHLLKRTLLLLKAWCSYEAHILGGQAGYIGSYAATVMLISMLNTVEFLEDVAPVGEVVKEDVTAVEVEAAAKGDGDAGQPTRTADTATTVATASFGHEERTDPQKEGQSYNLKAACHTAEYAKGEARPTSQGSATKMPRSAAASSVSNGSEVHRTPGSESCCVTGAATETWQTRATASPRTRGHTPAWANVGRSAPLSPLELLARFLKFYAHFDFERYCVTAFGPLPLHKISSAPLDLSYLEVDAAHSKPVDDVAASHRASADLSSLGLTPEGEATLGHLVRRQQRPLVTVSGVKHLLNAMNHSRLAERRVRLNGGGAAKQHQQAGGEGCAASPPAPRVQLNRAGCAVEDADLMCPSCNTALFPVRDMNVLDPLRWSSNMVRGVCRNHLQRIQRAFREGLRLLDTASQALSSDASTRGIAGAGAGRGAVAREVRPWGNASMHSGAYVGHVGGVGARAASPTSQWSAFSAASSSSQSWADSGANRASGVSHTRALHIGTAPQDNAVHGSADNELDTAGPAGVSGELQLCTGYPAPHSQCSRREVQVLQLLFSRTLSTVQRNSAINCPWNRDEELTAQATGLERCAHCSTWSLLCTPDIHRMCDPQLTFHPVVGKDGRGNDAADAMPLQLWAPASSTSPVTSPGTVHQAVAATPPVAPPTHGAVLSSVGSRRGNLTPLTAEQLAHDLEDALAREDTSEAARAGGPLGESMVPPGEIDGLRDRLGGVGGSSQAGTNQMPLPPPPSTGLSYPRAASLHGSAQRCGMGDEAEMHHRHHQYHHPQQLQLQQPPHGYSDGSGGAPYNMLRPPGMMNGESYAWNHAGASGADRISSDTPSGNRKQEGILLFPPRQQQQQYPYQQQQQYPYQQQQQYPYQQQQYPSQPFFPQPGGPTATAYGMHNSSGGVIINEEQNPSGCLPYFTYPRMGAGAMERAAYAPYGGGGPTGYRYHHHHHHHNAVVQQPFAHPPF